MAAAVGLSAAADKALKLFEEGCLPNRAAFLAKLRDRHRAYHGLVDNATDDAAGWKHQLHPPFVGHIVESSLASIIDGRLAYKIKPAARMYDPDEYALAKAGAQAHDALHRAQLKADRFHETQQPFALQDAIVGLTVAKTHWRREVRMKPRLKVVPDERAAEIGVFLPRLVETEALDVCFDGPTTEVVNVEDFFWHEAATEVQRSPVLGHRVWMHYSDLKRLEHQGVYKNVDELKDARGQGGEYSEYRVTDGTSRSKDMVEVLEIWWQEPDGRHTVTIGERKVELRAPRVDPFWHGEYPFVTASMRPDLFSIPGKSQVEKIMDMQAGHWDLFNQMLDNVSLANNAVFGFDEEMVDRDEIEISPGALWPCEGNPNEVLMAWTPSSLPTEVALPHLSRLEQAMQNLAGGYPFTTTSEGDTTGASTATQAALVTNIAERATVRLKEQLAYAYERIGQQRMELNQQFLRTSIMVEDIGIDTPDEFMEIAPWVLQGSYRFDITPMVESLARSERRAEANALFTTFLQAASVYAALQKAGAATGLDADEFARQWIESYDIGPAETFFSKKQMPQQAQPQQPSQSPPPAPGITAQQSIDPSVSPSAQASMSPETHLARLGASRGGAANV